MHTAVFQALEFDRVREALARATLTPLGRVRALALEPSVEPDDVGARLGLTSEAVAFLGQGGSLALKAPAHLESTLAAIEVEGRALDPLELLGLADLLESVDRVAGAVRRAVGASPGSAGQRLAAVAQRAASFEREAAAVRRAIDPAGDVSDDASPALRDIRETLRRQRARLRSTLDRLTRSRDTAKYLQDQIVTDRNGRYVVVVRAEHRDAIAGIVHGSSTSGASLYLEPLSTVALNNEVVTLVERERAEVHRILLALSDAFRGRGDELESTLDTAAELDELHAKAELARRTDAVAPSVAFDGRIDFRDARHPLLIPSVRELLEGHSAQHGVVVGSDLTLVPPARVLVISGPNTGGKTVALKATGLLALMAQAGLLIPVARGSRFTPFRSIFADIGDDQSISASLSTFSARIANIVAMDRALALPALVLLDEVGGGTDPAEGGALGAAIVDHFRSRGALVVATTHDDTMKSYASTTVGAITAGFGFDPETYAPTYRLIYGAPGRSLAFEIAERLGMPADVVADARSRRSGRESQLAAHLARMDGELAELERDRRTVAAEHEALAHDRRQLLEREARIAEREAVMKRRLDDRLSETLREARAEVDRVVAQLKQRAGALVAGAGPAGPRLSTGDVGELRAAARDALDDVAGRLEAAPPPASDALLEGPPAIGETVFVPAVGTDGVVRELTGKQVVVEIRGKRLRINMADLRASTPASSTGQATRRRPAGGSTVVETRAQVEGPSRQLVVIGATVDEAIDRAEKFLDDALLSDERRLRIVHGHGTGRLREALTRFFRQHPLVASASPAPENEGGAGATIVELKE
jgi:DNA mismatch repair protein MutS2